MTRRQTATVAFIVLCVVLVAAAVSLNVGWILVNGRRVLPLVLGVLAFALIIAGIVVFTVFLVRELRRNEQHDAFINSVTHELKTPIASIRLYLETLQAREVGDQQRKEFYKVMLADAERLQHTVEQVLKAGVAGQRPRLAQRAPVDMAALTRECVETARRRHHLPDEAITLTIPDSQQRLFVSGDVDELRAALSNLLDNAVKYSLQDVQVRVEVAAPEPRSLWVRVRDRGVGIPKSQLKRIFTRFYRFQTRGYKVKGTGLGLFIVRSVARQHGGRVFAHSEGEGQGATFTLELPRLSPEASRRGGQHSAPGTQHLAGKRCRDQGSGIRRTQHSASRFGTTHQARFASRPSMPHILVVEDEVHLADGLRFNLEADGHTIDVEGDGDEALKRLLGGEIPVRCRDPRRHAAGP